MTDRAHLRLVQGLLVAVVAAQALFAAYPRIDIAVSGLFADGGNGFPWATGTAATLNLVIRRAGELTALLLVLWVCLGAAAGALRGADLRVWGFAGLSVVLSSLLVNQGLKANIGRARPASIAEFGGTATFTPAWQVSDQCVKNCSFTSGEVALAFSLSAAVLVLIWSDLRSRAARRRALGVAAAYTLAVMLLRIGVGRHFLSDTVFSVLISAAVALALYPMLQVARARQGFDPRRPFLAAHRGLAEVGARARALLKRAA